MTKFFGKLLLTMFNIGKINLFPGTIASGVTSLIYLILFNIKINYIILLIFLFIVTLISIMLINILKDEFDEIDSKEIVIDEFVGQSILDDTDIRPSRTEWGASSNTQQLNVFGQLLSQACSKLSMDPDAKDFSGVTRT